MGELASAACQGDGRLRNCRADLVLQSLRQEVGPDAGTGERLGKRVSRGRRKRHTVRAPQLRDPGEGIAGIEPRDGVARSEKARVDEEDWIPQIHPLAIALEAAVDSDAVVGFRADAELELPRRAVVPDERFGLGHSTFERQIETACPDETRQQPRCG
jgi:hypothetical protein